MTKRLRTHLFRQFSMRSWAARVLCFVLFAWTTVYNPLHLLLEAHSAASEAPPAHQTALSSGDQDHGPAKHRIHLASDHQIRATCQSETSGETGPVLFSTVSVSEAPRPYLMRLFLVERVNPPGSGFASPLLPRAPPIC